MTAVRQHASPFFAGTNAERIAYSPPSDQRLMFFYETDTDDLYRWNGTSWVEVANSGVTGIDDSGWVAAGETWTYASADDPTFTFTVTGDQTGKYSAGMRIKLTQSATIAYFIITKVAYSNPSTTVTVYGGTDYDLADAAISDPYYSVVKAPHGFPLDPGKWTVETSDTSNQGQATPTKNVWYNVGSLTISIPIGCWRISYHADMEAYDTNVEGIDVYATLSTANNSESDVDMTNHKSIISVTASGKANALYMSSYREKTLAVAAKTAYYLNVKTSKTTADTINVRGDLSKTFIRAACAYL